MKSIAFNAWTAETLWQNCIKHETLKNYKPDFCTLLIGVNDWFDGGKVETFQANFSRICNYVTHHCNAKLLVITIPNYLISQEGQRRTELAGTTIRGKKGRIFDGKTIEDFNSIIKTNCKENGIEFIEINQPKINSNWIHDDGIHLSPIGNEKLAALITQKYKSSFSINAK